MKVVKAILKSSKLNSFFFSFFWGFFSASYFLFKKKEYVIIES